MCIQIVDACLFQIFRRTRRVAVWETAETEAFSAQTVLMPYKRHDCYQIIFVHFSIENYSYLFSSIATGYQAIDNRLTQSFFYFWSVSRIYFHFIFWSPSVLMQALTNSAFSSWRRILMFRRCSSYWTTLKKQKGFTCLRFLHSAELVPT